MGKMSELWENMKEDDKVGRGNCYAYRSNDELVWCDDNKKVCFDTAMYDDWQLVKEGEKEIETEKWERYKDQDSRLFYRCPQEPNRILYMPSDVMNRRNFLRWVGKMPDGEEWPGSFCYLWFHEEEEMRWSYHYQPKIGFIVHVFADYAEMRVEK